MKRKKPDWTPFEAAMLAEDPAEHGRMMALAGEIDRERVMGCMKQGAVA
jgi:hypothetical protein